MGQGRTAARLLLAVMTSCFWAASAYAAPVGGGGGGGTLDPRVTDCLNRTTTSFTASPSTISLGGATTLNWSVRVPADCASVLQYASLDAVALMTGQSGQPVSLSLNDAAVQLTGSELVHPMSSTEFKLQMIAGRGVATLGDLTVTVQLPSVVHIKDTTPEWQGLLVQAAFTPNTTIYLASNVDMDLSNVGSVAINEGVSIIGGEPCDLVAKQSWAGAASVSPIAGTAMAPSTTAATPGVAVPAVARSIISPIATTICGGRSAQQSGPRLYTTNRPNGLLTIPCDEGFVGDVHLEGFRVQGPHWGSEDGDDNLERGIIVSACNHIDIGNMELSGWSGAAVYVIDSKGVAQFGPEAVKIHDSFIHHNQHIGGNGYGVDVSHGGWALVERNIFDFNRHAVTHGSVVGNAGIGGYTANYNLILKGGGYHGKIYEEYTQQFDVHGDNNCVDGLPASLTPSGIWNCGRSGKEYHVNFNAFQYSNANSFKLRGTPKVGAFIDNNVFPRPTGDVVGTDGWGTIGLYVGSQNRAPLDTFGQYGVCDFDGNGHDGLFLATGTSWWYMSSAKRQWTYLNSYTDTLDQLALGDFFGTGRCDVFAVHGGEWVISRGGREPWQSLGTFNVPFDQLRFGHFTDSPRTEIFRRAPDGQWWIISPGAFGWTPLQSSSLPLNQLHFGNFNGRDMTDVIAVVNGQWSVSWGGRTAWQPLNAGLSESLDHVMIADFDGKGTDDILRYNGSTHAFEVSIGGRTGWQQLVAPNTLDAMGGVFVGHFEDTRTAEILEIGPAAFPLVDAELLRRGHIFSRASGAFTPYGIYAY